MTRKAIDNLIEEDCSGYHALIGYGEFAAGVILLADDLNEIAERVALVHEMAHFKVNWQWKRRMGHGRHFKAEMRRLVSIGELDDWL
jgi:hypothetical protein